MSILVEGYIQDQVQSRMDVVNQEASIDNQFRQFDQVMDDFFTLVHCSGIVKKYGLTEQFVDLVDHKKRFSTLTNIDISTATESQVNIALEGIIGDAWKAIVDFFKSIWQKIKELFGASASNSITAEEKFMAELHTQLNREFGDDRYDKSSLTTQRFALIKLDHLKEARAAYIELADKFASIDPAANPGAINDILKAANEEVLVRYIGVRLADGHPTVTPRMIAEERTLKEAGVDDPFATLHDLQLVASMRQTTLKLAKAIKAHEAAVTKILDKLQKQCPNPADLSEDDQKELDAVKNAIKEAKILTLRLVETHGWIISNLRKISRAIKEIGF